MWLFFISHYLLLFVMFQICVVPRENVVELHLASGGHRVSGRAAIFLDYYPLTYLVFICKPVLLFFDPF